MKTSPHTHTESYLTGSTVANLVKRAKELGRTHFAITDNGHMASGLKSYNLAKKAGLKPIIGIEFYFKDAVCPVIAGTKADRCNYFQASLYVEDQAAYQALCKLVSKPNRATVELHEEPVDLWTWDDVKEMSKYNTNIVLGGIHCMVGKTYIAGEPRLGEQVLLKLKELFPARLAVALVAEPWTKKFSQVVEISFMDGNKTSCLASDIIATERARRMKASDLIERMGHTELKSVISGGVYNQFNQRIDRVKLHKGFLPLPMDVMLSVNKFLLALSKKHSLPAMVSDYAYYAEREDKIVQTVKLEGKNKLHSNLHMKNGEEIYSYLYSIMALSQEEATKIVDNNETWAKKFDNFTLKYDWRLAEPDGDPLKLVMDIIRKNGRMEWNNPKHVDRLREEISVIAKNGKMDMSPYFLPICGVVEHYKANGRLTGPGRGSAAGSFLAYLLGITEVDPFVYDLSFSRFYSMDRILANKIADIDQDLEDRELLVGLDGKSGYLYGKYGDRVAQVSTRQNVRLKSAIKDVNRYFHGKVEREVEILSKGLPSPPQGRTDLEFVFGYNDDEGEHIKGLFDTSEALQKYAKDRPKEWEIVQKALGVVRTTGKHACAFLISNCPISDVVPIKDGNVTQVEAKEAEFAGMVKMDFLVINQLKDLRVCMDLINKRNGSNFEVGYFLHKGVKTHIWKLPEDLDVYKSTWDGDTDMCFQVNTKPMGAYQSDLKPKNIEDQSLVLSLHRPGPLDFIDPKTGINMAQEYVRRRNGGSYEDIEILKELIPETYSVLCYQEQITRIAKNLAGFNGLEAENLREAIGKKKQSDLVKIGPKFTKGVIDSGKTTEAEAKELWQRIVTFGNYAFNKSHGISYALITYACMFLRYHYKLEFVAAVLTNAEEKEITQKLGAYVREFLLPPDINLSGDSMVPDYSNNKIRAKLGVLRGVGEATIAPILENRPYKDIKDFVEKYVAGQSLSHKLILVGVLDSLFPPKTNLVDKFKMYQNAIEIQNFNSKLKKAELAGKKTRATQPKEGVVPEEYINLHPLKDAALKKSILPSMPIDLYSLGAKYSKVLAAFESVPSVIAPNGYNSRLMDGERLRLLNELEGDMVESDHYVAATCYIIKTEEFSYAKGAKRALKVIADAGTYSSEFVMWPNYDSGVLEYPAGVKRGAICTLFLRKKTGKKDMSIQSMIVEQEAK